MRSRHTNMEWGEDKKEPPWRYTTYLGELTVYEICMFCVNACICAIVFM